MLLADAERSPTGSDLSWLLDGGRWANEIPRAGRGGGGGALFSAENRSTGNEAGVAPLPWRYF